MRRKDPLKSLKNKAEKNIIVFKIKKSCFPECFLIYIKTDKCQVGLTAFKSSLLPTKLHVLKETFESYTL